MRGEVCYPFKLAHLGGGCASGFALQRWTKPSDLAFVGAEFASVNDRSRIARAERRRDFTSNRGPAATIRSLEPADLRSRGTAGFDVRVGLDEKAGAMRGPAHRRSDRTRRDCEQRRVLIGTKRTTGLNARLTDGADDASAGLLTRVSLIVGGASAAGQKPRGAQRSEPSNHGAAVTPNEPRKSAWSSAACMSLTAAASA